MSRSDLEDAIAALTEMLKPCGEDAVQKTLADLALVTSMPSTENLSHVQARAAVLAQLDAYVPFLRDVPADILAHAGVACARRSKFFPKPAEILEFAQIHITERHDMRRLEGDIFTPAKLTPGSLGSRQRKLAAERHQEPLQSPANMQSPQMGYPIWAIEESELALRISTGCQLEMVHIFR
jgi:hypothetical protein